MDLFDIRPAVASALHQQLPVVALESTLISHGLPFPVNLQTAHAAEEAVRSLGAVPATIAVLDGRPTIGLSNLELEQLAQPGAPVYKASTRDLAAMICRRNTASTTVASTMALAYRIGILVFATGGIGGVHPAESGRSFDVSADLTQLSTTPMTVVCSGAQSILDLPATLEYLETLGVPVVGYRTKTFPAFYEISSGLSLAAQVETPTEAAELIQTHHRLSRTGILLTQPVSPDVALSREELTAAIGEANQRAHTQSIHGPALTPFLLKQLADLTEGKTLRANQRLIVDNARLAAEVAVALQHLRTG